MKMVLEQFIVKRSEHNLENLQVIYEIILSKIQIMAHSKQTNIFIMLFILSQTFVVLVFSFHTICVQNIFQGIKKCIWV